jgi:murein DD-endopeptidase MepM/ murein hydrolase activator NlpD
MAFFELMSNNDSTYEYITNSSSMTELIMRQEAVNLVSSSFENKLKTLEGEIVSLEKQELELKALQIQLEKDIVTYESKLKKLNYNLSSLVEITEDIDDQIKNQKALISYYEGIGCKENQSLDECEGIANNRGWLKPLVKGYISSDFGYRKDPITGANSSFHNGIDIAVGDGTKVYSATNGRVAAITVRSSCGGNKVYVYSKVDGQNYTVIYLHLLRIDVKVGQAVTTETIIGLSGGGSTSYKRGGYDTCTTGAHLHFGVAKGFYLTDYHSYASLVAKSIKPPGFPGKYGTFYSRTQWFN